MGQGRGLSDQPAAMRLTREEACELLAVEVRRFGAPQPRPTAGLQARRRRACCHGWGLVCMPAGGLPPRHRVAIPPPPPPSRRRRRGGLHVRDQPCCPSLRALQEGASHRDLKMVRRHHHATAPSTGLLAAQSAVWASPCCLSCICRRGLAIEHQQHAAATTHATIAHPHPTPTPYARPFMPRARSGTQTRCRMSASRKPPSCSSASTPRTRCVECVGGMVLWMVGWKVGW